MCHVAKCGLKESSLYESVGRIVVIHPMSAADSCTFPESDLAVFVVSILKSGGRAQIC